MKFEPFSGSRRTSRRRPGTFAPAIVETFENKTLLSAANVLSPTGTVATAQPTITWEAVDQAVSYDLWITNLDTRQVLLIQNGITGTNFTPSSELTQGRIGVWVRANFADSTQTAWSVRKEFLIQVQPLVTGPVNMSLPASPRLIDDTTPKIEWTAAPGAREFELFFSNQTEGTSTIYRVSNPQVRRDTNGDPVVDNNGALIYDEVREFEIPNELKMGAYRVFIRTTDRGQRLSNWSPAYDFDVAPQVRILRPTAPTFQSAPLLEWSAVNGATNYDFWVSRKGAEAESQTLYRGKLYEGTSFQIPRDLPVGDYVFWVRAKVVVQGKRDVEGIWSARAEFSTVSSTVQPQVSTISVSGTPTSGTYQIRLTPDSYQATTRTTATLPYNATAAQVQAAIRSLPGFAGVSVTSTGTSPNYVHTLRFMGVNTAVLMEVVNNSTNGVFAVSTTSFPVTIAEMRPTVTGPIGVDTNIPGVITVTDPRPTFTWSAIDGTARYEIWVDRTAGPARYLVTTSGTTTYTMETDILPGNYWVWVRAVSATGVVTRWSAPYKFTATGGAPVILSPAENATTGATPTFQWTPVAGAVSYEIWIAYIGVDPDYIVTTDIPLPEYTDPSPLPSANYRVWVRAVLADGTKLRWSSYVNFTVASIESETDRDTLLLTSLPQVMLPSQHSAAETETRQSENAVNAASAATIELAESQRPVAETTEPKIAESVNSMMPLSDEIVAQLAEQCSETEWWTQSESATL